MPNDPSKNKNKNKQYFCTLILILAELWRHLGDGRLENKVHSINFISSNGPWTLPEYGHHGVMKAMNGKQVFLGLYGTNRMALYEKDDSRERHRGKNLIYLFQIDLKVRLSFYKHA